MTTAKTYTIKVKAKGDGAAFSDSEWSEPIAHIVRTTTQQLAVPSNLSISGTSLTWNAVENASAYTVDVDGNPYNAPENSFLLPVLSDYKTYTIKVKALGNGTTYTDSPWSDTTAYVLEEPNLPALDTPQNVQIAETVLTWDTVSGAVRYSVEINGKENPANTNSYSLSGLTATGTYTIKV
ncbi:MAG: hypothetical protein LBI06_03225, partial [Treponema sp.]|nr:hypothetical protein [Treponema sp.]